MLIPCHSIINSIGLVLDIAGAVLLWRYGLPEAIDRKGHIHIIAEQTDASELKKAITYDFLARVGICSLIAGFIFQLVSNFV